MPRLGNKGGFPFKSADAIEAAGPLTASSLLTTITAGANYQWGAWTQYLAATAKKAFALIVCVAWAALPVKIRIQVGVGAAASEVPVADMSYAGDSTGYGMKSGYSGIFFRKIPAGSRVAVRGLSDQGAGVSVYVGLWLMEVNEDA